MKFFFFLVNPPACDKKWTRLPLSGESTSEAPLSAMSMTWLLVAVHKTRSQLSEQIRTSDGMMHSGFESRKNVPRNDE